VIYRDRPFALRDRQDGRTQAHGSRSWQQYG